MDPLLRMDLDQFPDLLTEAAEVSAGYLAESAPNLRPDVESLPTLVGCLGYERRARVPVQRCACSRTLCCQDWPPPLDRATWGS